MTRPTGLFEQTPNGEAIAMAYPDKAVRENREGVVTLSCTVTAERRLAPCTVMAESTPGYFFGSYALLLAPLFLVRDGAELPPDRQIEFKIAFRLPTR